MTKRELVDALAKKTGLSKRKTERILADFAEMVMEKVANGEKVSITGFGVFDLGKRAARHGVDPRSQKDIQIPAMKNAAVSGWETFQRIRPQITFGHQFAYSERLLIKI